MAALASDVGWVAAAIEAVGVDRVLADLRQAVAGDPTHAAVSAMLAVVTGQAHHLRRLPPLDGPSYVLRQLWLQAAEHTEDALADDIRARLLAQPGFRVVPRWTTRRAGRALFGELGRHDGAVRAVAGPADGTAVSGGDDDGRVLIWDPAAPGDGPFELGRHNNAVLVVAGLGDGRVVSGGADDRVLIRNPATPRARPLELGCSVIALAAGAPCRGTSHLIVAHAGAGFSLWTVGDPAQADQA